MPYTADIKFLHRLIDNVEEIYRQEHCEDANVEDAVSTLHYRLKVCLELYERHDITEQECVKMMYWQFTDRRLSSESKDDTEGSQG